MPHENVNNHKFGCCCCLLTLLVTIIRFIMDGRIIYLSLGDESIREERVQALDVSSLYALADDAAFIFVFYPSGGTLAIYKSRQNGKIARDSANSRLAAKLSAMGICALVVNGSAHKLSYLYVSDDDLSLYHCENIRFSSPQRFFQVLSSDEADGFIAIGEAGERQSPVAACCCDSTLAIGRGGLAAMMGSANFKGLICHSTKAVMAEKDRRGLRSELEKNISLYGSAALVDIGLENGWMAVKHYQGYYDPRISSLNGKMACRSFNVEHTGCPGCALSCQLEDRDSGCILPSWHEAMALGSNLGIFSLSKVAVLKDCCMQYGLDCVDTGEILSYLRTQTDLPYTYPQLADAGVDEICRTIGQIGARKGSGELVSAGLSALPEAPGISSRSCAYDLRGAHCQAVFSMLGENSPCFADLVYNFRKHLDSELTGRLAAWLRIYTHALENRGISPVSLVRGFFNPGLLFLVRTPAALRFFAKGRQKMDTALIREGYESVSAFSRLFGPPEVLPDLFLSPGCVGYTPEVNVTKLMLGYEEELEYIRKKYCAEAT